MKKLLTIAILPLLVSCASIDNADTVQFQSHSETVKELREAQKQAISQLAEVQKASAMAVGQVGLKDGQSAAFAALALSVGNRSLSDAVADLLKQNAPDAPETTVSKITSDGLNLVKGVALPAFAYGAFKSAMGAVETGVQAAGDKITSEGTVVTGSEYTDKHDVTTTSTETTTTTTKKE